MQRQGFTSQEIIRRSDGSFEKVGPRARPGNWLPTGGVERYVLVLRLYEHADRGGDPHRTRRADACDHQEGLPVIRSRYRLLEDFCSGGSCVCHRADAPAMATQDAYARVSAVAPVNAAFLPPPTPEKAVMPFIDPAFAVSVCRYDLSRGTLKFSVPISPAYTSVSFYTRSDIAYYAINDRAAGRRVIELDLMTTEQRAALPENEEDHRGRPVDRHVADDHRPDRDQGIGARAGTAAAARTALAAAQCRPQYGAKLLLSHHRPLARDGTGAAATETPDPGSAPECYPHCAAAET